MAKRRVCVDNLTAAQPRVPKTRRKECPTKTDDIQANLQDMAADTPLPKESTMIFAVDQQMMAHQSLVTEGEVEKREDTDVSVNTKMATSTEVGPTASNNTHGESQPELLMAPVNNDTSQNGEHEEVIEMAEASRSEPHPRTDPSQVIQVTLAASEEQMDANESSHCDREKIQETDQPNSCSDSTSDVKEVTIENQAFPLPAKKKPRIEIFHQVEEVSSGPSLEFFQTGDAVQTKEVDGDGKDGAVVGLTQEGQRCKDQEEGVDSPQESEDTRSLKNQAAENSDATETTPPMVSTDTNVEGESSSHLACDAGEGSSSAESSSEGCPIGPAAPSLGADKKDTSDVADDKDTLPSFRSFEPCWVKGSREPFGPGYLDYVSDSQLNTIPLTEEEIVNGGKDLGSPDCPDGSDLICGLIKELSWLNRKVMATHRELESMRRNTKSLRSSTR